MRNHTPFIAVVEDGAEDFDLLKYAFEACGIAVPLVQYPEGGLAIDLFCQNPENADQQVPCIIFLDLNLPDIDGRDALKLLRATKAAAATPIIILTTSNNPQDITYCYTQGANGYIVKPVGVAGLKKMAIAFKQFWLEAAEIPL